MQMISGYVALLTLVAPVALLAQSPTTSHRDYIRAAFPSLKTRGALLQAAVISSGGVQTGAASISGVVVGDDGKAVRALITAVKSSLPASGGRTEADVNGSFAISGLLDGSYQLCAVDHTGTYLDPCNWAETPAVVTVSAKQPVAGYKLTVAKGALLQVRVNDVGQVLDKPAAALNQMPATLIVAVMTTRHTIQPLPIVSKDSGGRNHQTAIPLNKAVSLNLFGKGFTLADTSGKPLDVTLGTAVPVQIGPGQAPQPVTFTVGPAKP
ncbi:exported hypothetical protein [Candidatus Sulfopaludibacter sp. SbA4]|nr:exported hypothetical protein [Candidatus Sulfopaludibacter sp. SbA4]